MVEYRSIKVQQKGRVFVIQMQRVAEKNSLSPELISEFLDAMALAENDPDVILIAVDGLDDVFCLGMDFQTLLSRVTKVGYPLEFATQYFDFLKSLTVCSKYVVCRVKGLVRGGGVGIVAACDYVLASPKASMGLPEALFGLMPACVLPFLVRRVGFARASRMSLLTENLSSEESARIGLVDEVTEELDEGLRRILLRVSRLPPGTIAQQKRYMDKIWIIDDETRRCAIHQLATLLEDPSLIQRIQHFIDKGNFSHLGRSENS